MLYEGLSKFVRLNMDSISPNDMYQTAVEQFGYTNNLENFKRYVRTSKYYYKGKSKEEGIELSSNKSNIDDPQLSPPKKITVDEEMLSFISTLRKLKIVDTVDLSNMFDCSPKRILLMIEDCNSRGYEVLISDGKVIFNSDYVPEVEKIQQIADTEIIFGAASDPHFGSKSVQITALNEFCKIAKHNGVRHIFVPGDVLAGSNVYKGQLYDVYGVGADDQISSCLVNLPTGFEWYIMGGNHDYSFIRSGGQNPLIVLASQREDIHYTGFDEVDVPILNGVDLKMWHPSGGVPYSVSYRLQKGAEQIAFSELQSVVRGVKERPSIRFVLSGHLHIQMQALFGSIFGMQCGTFEGTTNYLKRKGLIPAVGGYIVRAYLGPNGLLKNFEAKFYVFEEIIDDWKNYNHSPVKVETVEKLKPIFEN